MKDISIYFDPINYTEPAYNTDLGSHIKTEKEHAFQLKKNSIALIFVGEYRGSDQNADTLSIASVVDKLTGLQWGDWKKEVYLLGQIKPGASVGDTYVALKEVVFELVKKDIFPFIIGGSQDLTYPIYQAYEKLEQTVNLLSIDSHFDLGDPNEAIKANGWLNKIILHQPNYLFNYANIGYQSYYVNAEEIDLFNQLYFDANRLGDYYTDSTLVEPLARNSDIISFDMNSIRSSDYSGNTEKSPHGFYGEDACRIMRYAGISDKLTSAGVFNLNTETGDGELSANLLAQMIWYFIEGFNQRKGDYPVCTKKNYIRYHVNIDDFKDEILFYKSDKSGRWWIEVPYPNTDRSKFHRHLLVPCTYQVYVDATKNEMPSLWWKTYQKLL
ncbi:arginase [Putridiphycobacter roseus]|uniref:Arginase n=1 Tax=Putridiphycobacter roseus TaxID=2219161 RepID=A0A2W1N5B6_9FLAO|nr:formimidoylglutamase [Putridiphycobacter roseus]PZE18321.1 arginase [Putridiphycobacter roseus]